MAPLPGQASLFDEVPAPRARRTDPRTSHLAAQSMTERANTHRARILEALADGPLTGDELDQRFSWRAATACRRLKELVDAGLIERCQELRFTSAGRPAHLYRLRGQDHGDADTHQGDVLPPPHTAHESRGQDHSAPDTHPASVLPPPHTAHESRGQDQPAVDTQGPPVLPPPPPLTPGVSCHASLSRAR